MDLTTLSKVKSLFCSNRYVDPATYVPGVGYKERHKSEAVPAIIHALIRDYQVAFTLGSGPHGDWGPMKRSSSKGLPDLLAGTETGLRLAS